MGTVKDSWENEETRKKRGEQHGARVYKNGIVVGEYPSTYQAFLALGLPQEKHIVGKDGAGQRRPFLGKDGHGQQKKADGFLDYMNDLTIKSKGLKTDAMNISNLV